VFSLEMVAAFSIHGYPAAVVFIGIHTGVSVCLEFVAMLLFEDFEKTMNIPNWKISICSSIFV
jgi:hypothetical protein